MYIGSRTVVKNTVRNLVLFSFFSVFFFATSFAQTTDSVYLYTSIHYKGSAKVVLEKQTYNCQYNLINKIDSFLYIQLNIGAMEVGRALLTPDNILFINKLQQNYYDGDYSFFQHLIGLEIDFYAIQAIFNGIPVTVSEDIELSYQGKSVFEGYSFFNVFSCETESYALTLEVKKVSFNNVPEVGVTIPKNYSPIKF